MHNKMAKALSALLVIGLLALVAAACGGGGSSSSGSTSEEAPASESTETSEAEAPTEEATGKPIVIGDITDASLDSTQSVVPAAQDAAADYINEHGGIGGRPVEVMHCDPKAEPAAANACINQFAQAHAIAITGASIIMGGCCVKTAEKLELPYFTNPNLPEEFSSEWGVLIGAGQLGDSYTKSQWAEEGGTKKVSVFTLDLPTTHYSTELKEQLLAGTQVELEPVYYKFGLADLTAPINQVLSQDPEKIMLVSATPDELKAVPAFEQGGIEPEQMISGLQSLDKEHFLEPLGEAAEGMYFGTQLDSFTDTSNEDVALYLKVMEEAGAPAESVYAQFAFSDMMMIWAGAKELKEPTAVALHEYFKTAGPLPIFMSGTLLPVSKTVKGFPALRYMKEDLVQWDAANEEVKKVKTYDVEKVVEIAGS